MGLNNIAHAKNSTDGPCDAVLENYKNEMQLSGDSILPFLDSIELSLKSSNIDCYYELLFFKGIRYEFIGALDKSLDYYQQLEKNKKYMKYPKLRAMLYSQLGFLNEILLNKYDVSFEYNDKAKEIALELGDFKVINKSLLSNARLFKLKGDSVKWRQAFEELFALLNKNNANGKLNEPLHYAYQEFGFGNIKYGSLDTTVKYFNMARSIGNANQLDDVDFNYFTYMGWAYISGNKPKIGLNYLDSITTFPTWYGGGSKAELYQYRAIGNFKLGQYKKVHNYLDSMLQAYKNPGVNESFYKWKYKTYRAEKRYKLALEAHENYTLYTDSIKRQEALDNVESVKKQIKSLKQEERIKLSEQRQEIFKKQRWLFAGAAGIIGLFVFLFIRQRNKKKINQLQTEMAEVQLASLKSQMNPHFMFNSINSIKGLIINEAADAAADQLTRFSKLMRSTLNYSISSHPRIDSDSSKSKAEHNNPSAERDSI